MIVTVDGQLAARAPAPDLEALRVLTLIGELGSISAAAARLGVSQQAASVRIRSLERELHVRLLARSPRGSHLTPAGELVAGWASPLLAEADEFTAAARSLREHRATTIRIAASLTIAEHLLPAWIARWRAHLGREGPLVQLTAANSASVIESLHEGTVDLGFIETPTVPAELGSMAVGYDTIEVVVASTHPWARNRTVSAPLLAATSLVLREPGSGTRLALESALAGAGHRLTAEPAAVIPSTLGVRSAVMAGAAPGALSSLAVAEDLATGRLVRVRIRDLTIRRPLCAVWTGRSPGASARSFLDLSPAAG